jgi:hypothetical protein
VHSASSFVATRSAEELKSFWKGGRSGEGGFFHFKRTVRCPLLAHRDISWRRSNSIAFGAKRTFSEPQPSGSIYEYAP